MLCSLGRLDHAWEFTAAGARTASQDDLASQILAGSARGRLLARRGAAADGEAEARRAVELAERTDFLNFHGDALMALGEVLDAAGRPDEAREAITRAGSLYEQKGNVVAAASAGAALAASLTG